MWIRTYAPVRSCTGVLDALAALPDDHLRHLRGDLIRPPPRRRRLRSSRRRRLRRGSTRTGPPPVVVPVVVRRRSAVVRVPVPVVRARGKRVRARDRPARRARRGPAGDPDGSTSAGHSCTRLALCRGTASRRIAVFAVPVAGPSVVRREPPVPRVAAIGAARAKPLAVAGRVRVSARRAPYPRS